MTDRPCTVLRNAFNHETFIFTGRSDDAEVARFDVVLGEVVAVAGTPSSMSTRLPTSALSSPRARSKVVIEGKEQIVTAGQSAVVPRGKPHYFVNAWDGDTEFTVEFRPAQQHLLFFANFARMTAEHPEWFSAKGDPPFLLIAASLNTFRDHIYLAGPPVWLQKALFAALAPLAHDRLC